MSEGRGSSESDEAQEREQANGGPGGEDKRSVAEWFTLAIGLVIVVGVLATVTWLGVARPSQPVRISITTHVTEQHHYAGGYYLPVSVTNEGDEAAQELLLRATLTGPGLEKEEVEFTIPSLGGGQHADAMFVFRQDPAAGTLVILPVGFLVP